MGADLLSPTHIIFIAVLALLLFGAKRLPEIGRGLGTGMREFKSSIAGEITPAQPATLHPADQTTPRPLPVRVEGRDAIK